MNTRRVDILLALACCFVATTISSFAAPAGQEQPAVDQQAASQDNNTAPCEPVATQTNSTEPTASSTSAEDSSSDEQSVLMRKLIALLEKQQQQQSQTTTSTTTTTTTTTTVKPEVEGPQSDRGSSPNPLTTTSRPAANETSTPQPQPTAPCAAQEADQKEEDDDEPEAQDDSASNGTAAAAADDDSPDTTDAKGLASDLVSSTQRAISLGKSSARSSKPTAESKDNAQETAKPSGGPEPKKVVETDMNTFTKFPFVDIAKSFNEVSQPDPQVQLSQAPSRLRASKPFAPVIDQFVGYAPPVNQPPTYSNPDSKSLPDLWKLMISLENYRKQQESLQQLLDELYRSRKVDDDFLDELDSYSD